MYILGISCFYHESSATLIYNGKIIAACAEERFTRKKHDSDFPAEAIKFCLKQANISVRQLDYVVFYEKPYWKFQRVLLSTLASYPFAPRLFARGMVNFLTDKLWVRSVVSEKLKISAKKILFVPHHISHAASAFYPSGFEKAAILTIDGVGEWTTTAFGIGDGNKLKITSEVRFPHSIGLLYSVFTAFLGFQVNDGEYKVMGMAPYGKPRYLSKINRIVKIFPDGSFALDLTYFSFHKTSDASYNSKFVKLFGKARPSEMHFFTKKTNYPKYFGKKPKDYQELCRINQHYADIAASIQKFTEDAITNLAVNLHKQTGLDNLCIAGGVGLNSVANGILLAKGPFKNIFVQPAAGDDGGSLGAALYAYYSILSSGRNKKRFVQDNCYLGQGFGNSEIEVFLRKNKIKYTKIRDEKKLVDTIASELAKEKVVGFFHGRAEWGPRALGARSILASPRTSEMKEIINTKVKFREPYRPFAPVVLSEKVKDYFEVGNLKYENLSKFMLGVFPVKEALRSLIPAVTHIDGSGRIQTISKSQNSRYYDIVKSFGAKTGVYVLTNTSFNLKGEPVVNSPEDAFKTFKASGLDLLALENCLVYKNDVLLQNNK